jgi:predicted peroxiredoxin
MTTTRRALGAMLFACALAAPASPARAGDSDPLFINLTTDDGHRSGMALTFGGNQLKRGHALTVFLNDKGVLLGAKANAEKYPTQQKMIGELLAAGATILVCPMCLKQNAIAETDLLAGLRPSNPELISAQLFKDGGKTLTW